MYGYIIITCGNDDVNRTYKRSKPTSESDLLKIWDFVITSIQASKMRASGRSQIYDHCVRCVVLRFGREGDQ